MMSFRMKAVTVLVTAAALVTVPVAAATAAEAELAQTAPAGYASITATGRSDSAVRFDVGGGAHPVLLSSGGVGVADDVATSEALPTSIDLGDGRTVTGAWTIDDADTITFHILADSGSTAGPAGVGASLRSSDWTSPEWGHCVAGNGIGAAAAAGFIGSVTGPGAIVAGTGGLLGGIIKGAFTC